MYKAFCLHYHGMGYSAQVGPKCLPRIPIGPKIKILISPKTLLAYHTSHGMLDFRK